MIGFEEQWDNDGFLSNCSMQDAKHFYEAGAASRQAEIDALKEKINSALKLMREPMRGTTSDLLSDIEDILG